MRGALIQAIPIHLPILSQSSPKVSWLIVKHLNVFTNYELRIQTVGAHKFRLILIDKTPIFQFHLFQILSLLILKLWNWERIYEYMSRSLLPLCRTFTLSASRISYPPKLYPPHRLFVSKSHFSPQLTHSNLITINQTRKMSTQIPQTMKGVLIEKTGGVEVLDYRTDLPVPVPKEGEVLVKNEFVGVNYIDT